VLRALRSKLAEALAQVHAAASLLHLRSAKSSVAEEGQVEPGVLLETARNNIHECATVTAKVPQPPHLPPWLCAAGYGREQHF